MQTAFFSARHIALRDISRWKRMGVAVCFPYYHGYPGEGDAAFDAMFDLLRRHHHEVSRIQVTHARMHSLMLEAGVHPDKVKTIVIGVDTAVFTIPTDLERRQVRERLGIPASAVVVGSFQKDGNGWADGFEPKRVKGPDVLVAALVQLKTMVPELWVLLSGPARGFVARGLTAAGIPFVHANPADPADVPSLYHALDAYVVASRQEGGPKAILESMASGVPIISTPVGQATALVTHGETGWLADVEDAAGLADGARRAVSDSAWLGRYRVAARATAEAHDYNAQAPLWADFFSGLLPLPTGRKLP
jgi:glycosyltransferase involved in cell wall biosynthesis